MILVPRWIRSCVSAAFFLPAFLGFSPASRATIRYEVSLAHPESHLFRVAMRIPDVSGEVVVQLPAWNALYQIRDFASHVQQVQAFVGGQPAPIGKLDKQTWRITGVGTITIRYTAYWDEPGPFATQLNSEHAFINPALILLYARERRSEDVDLSLRELPEAWRVAGPFFTTREKIGRARNLGFDAKSYDELTDAPIEAGQFDEFPLTGMKPDVWVVVHGDNWKKSHIEETLRRICAYEIKMMGGAPFERYVFIFHIGKAAAGAGGGMEHANSTAISIPPEDSLPGVSAHEFFHLWNVKRIRPATLEPADYTKEQYTRALWFAEGVTSTYGSYTLVRTGLWSKGQFYQDLGEQITELESRPANRWKSAEESSLDAWLEKYPLYNGPDYSVSYYTKGQILGVLMDLLIRERTNNSASLDDVLRAMNSEFAKKGRAYRDSLDVRLVTEEIAGSSFEEFFRRYVAAAEPLPYAEVLALGGLELRERKSVRAALGFSIERDFGGEVRVMAVSLGSGAAVAGLRVGDNLLRWNDGEVPRRLERWLREQKPGDKLRLRARRDGKEMTLEFPFDAQEEMLWQVEEASGASEKAKRIREGILRGVTQPRPAAATP